MHARRHNHTITCGRRIRLPMILGLLGAMLLGACESPPKTIEKISSPLGAQPSVVSHQPTADSQRPAVDAVPAAQDEPEADITHHVASHVKDEVAAVADNEESDTERSGEQPEQPVASVIRIDPGAAYIARSISERLTDRDRDAASGKAADPIVIHVGTMRNQSRSSPHEFRAFLERFAAMLTAAGDAHGLHFTSEPDDDEPVDYVLTGTAYLLPVHGDDWWELFISMTPIGGSWAIWRCEQPLRVMRQSQPEHQQMFLVTMPYGR